MTEDLTEVGDAYRTGYIVARWNVSKRCALALQVFELGYSVSGVAEKVGVTESTARSYKNELGEKINPAVTTAITESSKRWDVWGNRSTENYANYSYEDGLNDGESARNIDVTTSSNQTDDYFNEPQPPINKGVPFEEIDDELIEISC
jgi:hypothetical protein